MFIKKTPYRISKDQNGAYGTANNYGDGFISKILRFIVKNMCLSRVGSATFSLGSVLLPINS